MLKADFHIHSRYSGDCSTTLEQVIDSCLKKNINCIALSDHNSVEGALKLKKIAPFYVIVAEEILTRQGEIMGMFLTHHIPPGLSIQESIKRIKDQGGLFCAQHPFDKFRSDALQADVMNEVVNQIDLVEVFNARTPLLNTSKQARRFAEEHNLPACAGSDAHAAGEIGNAYVEMPEFNGKEDFLQALKQGTVYGHRASPFCHFNSLLAKLRKRKN